MTIREDLPFFVNDDFDYLQVITGFPNRKTPIKRQTDAMLKDPAPKATGGVSQVPTEAPDGLLRCYSDRGCNSG